MSTAQSSNSPSCIELETGLSAREVSAVIHSLKEHVANDRTDYIKKRIKANNEKVQDALKNLYKLSLDRTNVNSVGGDRSLDLLAKRQKDAVDMYNVVGTSGGTKGSSTSEEDGYTSSPVLLGHNMAVKNAVCPIKLPEVEKIPTYTSWIFLDRNQRMTEDQSVVGRRRIYYDQKGGEALVASDSEEEAIEDEDSKKEFGKSEDYVLRMTIKEAGLSDTTLDLLARTLNREPCEIQGRYECLIKNENATCNEFDGDADGYINPYIDKDLDAALDSFDNLFCRRCLVFDCKLHGCSQDLVFPKEKPSSWTSLDVEKDPCGPNCYILVPDQEEINYIMGSEQEVVQEKLASASSSEIKVTDDVSSLTAARKYGDDKTSKKREAEKNLVAIKKKQKNIVGSRFDYVASRRDNKCWKPLEKALCRKGFEIFGRNSCLIARNLFNGSKSCSEVFNYMASLGKQSVDGIYLAESDLKVDGNGAAAKTKSRFLHKKGRVRRLKFTLKSGGYPSFRKRNSEMKDQHRQYNPCGCQSACGRECPCQVNGTCCEKFCGCKDCKNRFRGCHCAKSQCRSRQCPCFAAERECDPDVCRNCWIGCGHDTIVGPSQSSDNKCRNMKLRLGQRQRVMLGRSDVSGWGAFLKNSVAKNEYLGEYTGELISHYEAEKRGKIYDRVNQSFLFNLNNQFVLDAYRKGDKLKFANHSPDPNCYAKVVVVNGDHRVGIFAKQRINAGEELFYDYQYTPECTPDWAKKTEASGAKKADSPPDGRAKKNA